VYSLLGVTKEGFAASAERPGIDVDYRKPVSEIYKGVARHIIKKIGKLDVLCKCEDPEGGNGLP